MNRRLTTDDPRYAAARQLRAEGYSTSDIQRRLHIRFETVAAWIADMTATPRKPSKNAAPAPYAVGYRWTNTKWR